MSERYDPSEILRRVAEDIVDETTVDWDEVGRRSPEDVDALGRLRVIERIAAAHRSARASMTAHSSADTAPDSPLFAWGLLQGIEKIGEGGFAEVYRAWDARLQREVALKLSRSGASGAGSRRWIEEARRLARVRHPNVLVVHGAAVHDDRAGIWTDLIVGTTLEEWVSSHGTLGGREAALIVMEVCLAVMAVHRAGLIHGDVKASNIMREAGGRIVLMDFGSGHHREGGSVYPSSATPLISAPELLEGGAGSVATDVYALGVLLYWLVTGEYPVEGDSLEELRSAHREGRAVRLQQRRPDLPSAFVRVVERAVATDPEHRWTGPAELESALAGVLAEGRATRGTSRRRRRRGLVGAMAALLLVAAGAWIYHGSGSEVRSSASPYEQILIAGEDLDVDASMVQIEGSRSMELPPGSPVAPGMRLALRLRCSQTAHVYVLNEDEHGEIYVLFPVEGLDLSNPLSGGDHVLPGHRGQEPQRWVVTSVGAMERFLTIVSRSPQPAIERAIAELQRASAGREVAYSPLDAGMEETPRGVGGLAGSPASDETHRDVLGDLARTIMATSTDPDGLWVWEATFPNPAGGRGPQRRD